MAIGDEEWLVVAIHTCYVQHHLALHKKFVERKNALIAVWNYRKRRLRHTTVITHKKTRTLQKIHTFINGCYIFIAVVNEVLEINKRNAISFLFILRDSFSFLLLTIVLFHSTIPVRGVKLLGWNPLGLALKSAYPSLPFRCCSWIRGCERKSPAEPDSTDRGEVGVLSIESLGEFHPLGLAL